ncbi:flavodoxin family protein [uncultured Desulfobacter sp.]|uniref:flavodoxin family protein n=1 Tax=uncultured Desulfobacter sp. TaxID=240139 RepID=UPI0029F5A851|nr:flavodoxin family protein [uncultured Desulfobacter sp.]
MKSLVVYSSRTGNTQKVARAIYDALPEPKEIFSVKEAPDPSAYDFLALGFWVDKGTVNAGSARYMETVTEKKIGLFGTLGAYPDSDHAKQCLKKARALVQGNDILGTFLCQGKVDPGLIKMMETKMKNDPHHSMTPERKARLEEAANHPDEKDLADARALFAELAKTAAGKVSA